jgi:lipopolysaccharide/colanic/teichoic acid biosynthesis glycosyltransferase
MIRMPTFASIKIPRLERVNIQAALSALRGFNKRIFDIMAAFIGLIMLLPAFGLIAILIKRDSPGPVFYWGPRVGWRGRPFRILKFRTMYERSASYLGPRVTGKDDSRITPFGGWLRETKLNELPQLWNVLIGEMSLVGPRPEDPEIAKDWPEDARREILSVKPGITSPASILYHDEEALLSKADVIGDYYQNILPDKIRLDKLYVRNHSFFSDLDTIFWTAVILVPRIAQAKIPEGYLFAGPFSRLVHRYISWFLADLVVSLGAAGATVLLWRSQGPLNWGIVQLTGLAVVLAVLFSGVNSIAGLNRIDWSQATAEDTAGLVLSSGFVTLSFTVFDYLQSRYGWLPYPSLPVTMISTIGLMASIGFVVLRYRLRLVTGLASRWLRWRRNTMGVGERVLIVGAGEGSRIANWLLRHGESRWAFSVVGLVDDDQPTRHGMRVDGCWVLGGSADLPALIKRYDVGVVLLAVPHISLEAREHIANLCECSGACLVFLPDLLAALSKQMAQPLRVRAASVSLDTVPSQYANVLAE